MEEKNPTTWKIVNLEIEIQVNFVKVVSYRINNANCSVLTKMQYVLDTLLTQNTQPKYRDLSINNRTADVEHFCENIIYHYPHLFFCKYHDRILV